MAPDNNGGSCMHNEATTLYINQTMLENLYIKKKFDKIPQIG